MTITTESGPLELIWCQPLSLCEEVSMPQNCRRVSGLFFTHLQSPTASVKKAVHPWEHLLVVLLKTLA